MILNTECEAVWKETFPVAPEGNISCVAAPANG